MAVVNSAAMSRDVQLSLQILVWFLWINTQEGALGSMIVPFLICRGSSIQFSIVSAPISLLIHSTRIFSTSRSPFDNRHPNSCEVMPLQGFDLRFCNVGNMEHLSCSCWPFVCLLWKMFVSSAYLLIS